MSLCFQARSGIPVCAPQIVRTVCAAPVTSGLASASLCCGRDRFARDTAGRGTTAWSCSSDVPAVMDSAAERCESPAPGLRRRLRHRLWRRRLSPSSQRPLRRLATPPPTRRCCPRPQSRRQRWQRLDFMCARKTKEGWTDGWKEYRQEERGRKEGRKEGKTFPSLPMTDPGGNERLRPRKNRVRQRQTEGGVNNHTCLHL